MIIELLGPSGVGKTTMAKALALRLRQDGYAVRNVSMRRKHLLLRSLPWIVRAIQSWFPRAPQSRLAASMTDLLPPRSVVWSMRLRTYIGYLYGTSIDGTAGADITLLDQGFVQAICSLVLLSGIVDRRRVQDALARVPKSDLAIRVDAPLEVIQTHLVERRKRFGWIQRLLELELQTSLNQIEIVELVSEMLASKGQRSVKLRCFDQRSLAAGIEAVMSEVRCDCAMRRGAHIPAQDQRSSEEADEAVVAAPTDLEIRRRYQDGTFARRYLAAYAGPARLRTLAAWIIARRERRLVARALRECWPPPAVLLDMPCGTGKLAEVLATVPTQVVGADLSVAMMELARGAYPASRFSGFVCASGEQLPFRTAGFDTAVCLRLMHLVPPDVRRNITKELARIASRRVIVSFGVINSFQFLRLKMRHAIVGGASTPHPIRLADLRKEIEAARLRITRRRWILPVLSCECLLTLEKQSGEGLGAASGVRT